MTPCAMITFDERLRQLSELGDPLETLATTIPWEDFRPLLSQIHDKPRKSPAGRPAFDVVLMFKILILQTLHNLSDDRLEYQIRDRLSFMRFLGLTLTDPVPDATTVWRFRERLTKLQLLRPLFDRFGDHLTRQGLHARHGQIIDASIVPVPVQRNTRDENARIKAGEEPADWAARKRAQKDVEARWTKKHRKSHYGYKNHICVDAHHKLIRVFDVTPASVHDSQVFEKLLDPDNRDPEVWADSAYRSRANERILAAAGYTSRVHEKGDAQHALSAEGHARNRERSKIRVRVEHIFGTQETSLGGKFVRTIGLARVTVKIGLMNLAYNMRRYLSILSARSTAAVGA